MVFDLHIHTYQGSGDSTIRYEQLVPLAKKAGLDGLCLTEHQMEKTGIAEKLAKRYHFPVFEGMEAITERGHVLVFGVEAIPRHIYEVAELKAFVEGHGGAVIAAHPFQSEITRPLICNSAPSLTVEEACARPWLHLVDAMEVASGWSVEEDVDFCRRVCSRLGAKGVGGSDAHRPEQIGWCVTVFEDNIQSERDLVTQLKNGRFRAEDRRSVQQKNPDYWIR